MFSGKLQETNTTHVMETSTQCILFELYITKVKASFRPIGMGHDLIGIEEIRLNSLKNQSESRNL